MFLSLSLLVLLYFNSNTRQSAWLPPDQNLAHTDGLFKRDF